MMANICFYKVFLVVVLSSRIMPLIPPNSYEVHSLIISIANIIRLKVNIWRIVKTNSIPTITRGRAYTHVQT